MTAPYQYRYGGPGLLSKPTSVRRQQSLYDISVGEAQGQLDKISPEDMYADAATSKLYAVKPLWQEQSHSRSGKPAAAKVARDKYEGIETLMFSPEQMEKIAPGMQDAYGLTHGGINYRKIDKNIINDFKKAAATDMEVYSKATPKQKAWHEQKGNTAGSAYELLSQPYKHRDSAIYAAGAKYDPRSMIGTIMQQSVVMEAPKTPKEIEQLESDYKIQLAEWERAGGESAMGGRRSNRVPTPRPTPPNLKPKVDIQATDAKFNATLDEMLADEEDAYITYYMSDGEKGSITAYREVYDALISGAERSKSGYVGELDAQKAEQQGILDTARASRETEDTQKAEEIAARRATFAKLFNLRGK